MRGWAVVLPGRWAGETCRSDGSARRVGWPFLLQMAFFDVELKESWIYRNGEGLCCV